MKKKKKVYGSSRLIHFKEKKICNYDMYWISSLIFKYCEASATKVRIWLQLKLLICQYPLQVITKKKKKKHFILKFACFKAFKHLVLFHLEFLFHCFSNLNTPILRIIWKQDSVTKSLYYDYDYDYDYYFLCFPAWKAKKLFPIWEVWWWTTVTNTD